MRMVKFLCSTFILFFIVSCELIEKPKEKSKPDLNIPDYVYVTNLCTGMVEFLRNEYYVVLNLQYPFNAYPQYVNLYFRPGEGFYDCMGYPWIIVPGPSQTLTARKFVTNLSDMSNADGTETARSPDIQHDFTVVANGDTTHHKVESRIYGNIAAGTVVAGEFILPVQSIGDYYSDFNADPKNKIAERDENNNDSYQSFTPSKKDKRTKAFSIESLSETRIKSLPCPFVIYCNSTIYSIGDVEEFNRWLQRNPYIGSLMK